ncbi:hypothetical protein TS65_09985 [Aneurinibacillus migulanus]|nr:hypothetical protein TS65_09985 [Aneurinibacillus migulanus]KON94843.1 hypothetical protein AF333_04440 [Aneurinibacillus migulanus]
MKTKMITYRPNYQRAEKAAYNLLESSKVNALPVKVKKLARRFPNLKIKSYSWFGDKYGMDIDEVCEFADSSEGCCYYKKSEHKYLILYNDTIDNAGRIRWTIAHELGHFILRHNEITDKTIIARNSLSKHEYDAFEKEANCFARTLLAPPKVITALGKIDIPLLSDLCLISIEAASNVLNFINRGFEMGRRHVAKSWAMDLFKDFILEHRYGMKCLECNYYFVLKTVKFCPVCGTEDLTKEKGSNTMIYSQVELNELHTAIQCPRCGNENILGDYCQICGSYLVNMCTGFSEEGVGEPYQGHWHELDNGCGELLSGDARFCTKCGSTSTFYELGILKNWKDEKENMKLREELPF